MSPLDGRALYRRHTARFGYRRPPAWRALPKHERDAWEAFAGDVAAAEEREEEPAELVGETAGGAIGSDATSERRPPTIGGTDHDTPNPSASVVR